MRLRINWRLVLIASLSTTAIASTVLTAPIVIWQLRKARESRAAQLHPSPATDMEQQEILRALLSSESYLESPAPALGSRAANPRVKDSIVLQDTTVAFCATYSSRKLDASCMWAIWEEYADLVNENVTIPKKLRKELLLANPKPSSVPNPHIAHVILVPRKIIRALLNKSEDWDTFYRTYPGSGGYLEVSRAVVSSDRDSALIYVAYRCAWECGNRTLHYLNLSQGAWRTVARANL